MGSVVKTFTFSTGDIIYAAEHNTNYDTLYTLVNGNIDNDNVSATAAIAFSKLAALTSGNILVGNGSGVATSTTMSGDGTLANDGTLAVTNFTIAGEAQGDIMYFDGTTWDNLAAGNSGEFLKTQGAAANPVWAAVTESQTLQDVFDNGQTISIANNDNQTLAITNLDTTNNPTTVSIENDGTGNCLYVNQDGNGIGINAENAGTNTCVYVYQDGVLGSDKYALTVQGLGAQTNSALVRFRDNGNGSTKQVVEIVQDNVNSTGECLTLKQDGNAAHMTFSGDPTVASANDGDFWFTGTALNFYDGSSTTDLLTTSISAGSITPTELSGVANASAIEFFIDGGGSAITTGTKGYVELPFDCTIDRGTLLADQTCNVTVDVWRSTYAAYPPTDSDSITASAPLTIADGVNVQDSTLTGWSTTVTSSNILGFNVDSVDTATFLTVSLKVTRT